MNRRSFSRRHFKSAVLAAGLPERTRIRDRRHTCAALLGLRAGVDLTVIALWLGHESVDTTQIYLHADMTLKEQALARTTPYPRPTRPLPAPDTLLAFLEAL